MYWVTYQEMGLGRAFVAPEKGDVVSPTTRVNPLAGIRQRYGAKLDTAAPVSAVWITHTPHRSDRVTPSYFTLNSVLPFTYLLWCSDAFPQCGRLPCRWM